MFILEEPYVSSLLLKTLEKHREEAGFEVLENEFIKNAGKGYALNLLKKEDFKGLSEELFSKTKFYSNSENSINLVLESFPNSSLACLINLCKDKCAFRKALEPIYPNFLFKEVSVEELDKVDYESIGKAFIIKPSVGFLSLGVHKVRSEAEFEDVKKQIKAEIDEISKLFPKSVLNISKFIIEEIIEGEEFAVDVYYDAAGAPNILNILKHPFLDGDDVSDRAYITSYSIIEENLECFEEVLIKIGKTLKIKNFPMHIELISKPVADNGGGVSGKEVVPVEINPMRFAGWCTTDLAYFAYGINVYEYFAQGKKPNWKAILGDYKSAFAKNVCTDKGGPELVFSGKKDKIFYFAIAERPKTLTDSAAAKNQSFNYEALYQNFSNILEKREIDYTEKPVCAILFGSADSMDEINKILKLDMKSFVKS